MKTKRKPKIKRRVWKGWISERGPDYANAFGFIAARFDYVKWDTYTHRAKITVEWEQ